MTKIITKEKRIVIHFALCEYLLFVSFVKLYYQSHSFLHLLTFNRFDKLVYLCSTYHTIIKSKKHNNISNTSMKIAIVGANVKIKLINRFEYCMRLSDTRYLKLPFLIQNNLQTYSSDSWREMCGKWDSSQFLDYYLLVSFVLFKW